MNTAKAAISYINRGWAVMPAHSMSSFTSCSCGAIGDYMGYIDKHAMGKHPYPKEGHREASKDPHQIKLWWEEFPNANVQIATGAKSQLIVLDIDKKNGGIESLQRLELRYGKLPFTPKVYSGGGGFHFYFRYPGFEVRGRRDMMPGIDVMADGGRIIAPPSNHKSGKDYHWDEVANPDQVPLAMLPDWLLRLIMSKQSNRPTKPNLPLARVRRVR